MKRLCIMLLVVFLATASPGISFAAVGQSESGLITQEWYLDLNTVYGWGLFGATPAIIDLPGVNSYGGEPNADLEIVTGSDGMSYHYNPSISAPGLWRAIDSRSNIEWYKSTRSDEARGSVAVGDINGDGYPEIAGGTTSGHTIEVMDRFGTFLWTFPDPPVSGNFEWPTAPAMADVNPGVNGVEIIAVHRTTCSVVALDGDNTDGINDGIVGAGISGYYWAGQDGIDWDVLWSYRMPGGDCFGSAAVSDIDNDGILEVIAGSSGGGLYILDGRTGALKKSFSTGSIQATPTAANIDGDPQLEIVVGDLSGSVYVFSWDGSTGTQKAVKNVGSGIYSSAAVGNIDNSGVPAIVAATYGGRVYAFDGMLNQKWVYPATGQVGAFFASPSLVNAHNSTPYTIEWQMFRHDAMRTGFYGPSQRPLDVVIGSMDSYLYVIKGEDGTRIDRFQTSGPIHGSPTVGDVDGDGKLNIIFQSWGGYGWATVNDREWNIELAKMNQSPAADAGSDRTIECSGDGASLVLDGSNSSDPEGDALTYSWTWPGGSASGVNPSVSLPLGATTITLTVDDGNGGTAQDTVVVTVQDTTPPPTTAAVAGVAGQNGWYVSDVTVTLNASDTCTGVKEIHYTINGVETVVSGSTTSFTLSSDGSYSITYWAVDNAGREGVHSSADVNREATNPVTTPGVPSPPDDGNGYYRSCVPVTLTSVAGISGAAITEYSMDGGVTWLSYTGEFTVCGTATITYRTTSNAGNAEQPKTLVINIDTTPPTITATVTPVPNEYGWNKSAVTVHFDCSDAGSGIAFCTPDVTVSTEGLSQSVSGTAIDRAGNPAGTSVNLNVDITAPVISILGVEDGASYPLCTMPNPSYTVVDNLSGVLYQNAVLTPSPNTNGSGLYTYSVTATDTAGNTRTTSATYRMTYGFDGFLPPVTLDRPFKKGSTIPIKFTLSDGCGAPVTSAVATLSLQLLSGDEPVGDPIDATSNVPDSDNIFRHSSPDGLYIYNLATSDLAIGTYLATVTTNDGVTRSVGILIKQ